MAMGDSRWNEVTPSEFAHEREGLQIVRRLLPDLAPYHAWSNFEFRDRQGKWHEVDLLVVSRRRIHLVELKHYRGRLTGDSYRWSHGGRSEYSPLITARRKAQRLASLIKGAASSELVGRGSEHKVPWVQECVFLHASGFQCSLPPADRMDLFGIDGQEQSTGLDGLSRRLLEPPDPGARGSLLDDDAALLRKLFDKIGFLVRREREVGSWRLLGPAEVEGPGWQDWPAEQRVTRTPHRIRFFVTEPGASDSERLGRKKLVTREFELTNRLMHDAIARPVDVVEHELGTGLVYQTDRDMRRLDLWLEDEGKRQTLAERVHLIRSIAEAVDYAHRHHVVHRGLSPAVVSVRQGNDGLTAQVGDWQVAGSAEPTTAAATRLFKLLHEREDKTPEERLAEAYQAPEGRWNPKADRIRLDVFALGALSYQLVAGDPPATDRTDLRSRLSTDGALDLTAHLPEAPAELRQLIVSATRSEVSARLGSVREFLEELDEVDRRLADPDALTAGEVDPLDATAGAILGDRFTLVRRLGKGSTAVGLLVTDARHGDARRALKVALDDAAGRRLEGEAEVLAELGKLKHPRLVKLLEPCFRLGDHQALLLEYAGNETLADALRERSRLSLDLLERWGTDLLEALVALDKAGIDHRDIKPSNLGIAEQRSDRARHLVLYDFSLSRAAASAIEAGTPPYLDPFLGIEARPRWDSAAERYAAAVTLFQMATGQTPTFGDGQTDPTLIPDEATVEPTMFDPSIAGALTSFFRKALRRDVKERYHTAAEMLSHWLAMFTTAASTEPDGGDEAAEAAEFDTPLADAGLSPRELSALEPFAISTVGDLAALEPGRLSLRIKGVSHTTRLRVRSRAKRWREKFADRLAQESTRPVPSAPVDDALAEPAEIADSIVRLLNGPKVKLAGRLLLGLEDGVPDAFAAHPDLANVAGVSTGRISRIQANLVDAVSEDDRIRGLLDVLVDRAVESLERLGRVAWPAEVVADLAPAGLDERGIRVLLGLLRCALDRADQVERNEGDRALIRRRRRRRDRSVLVALDGLLLDAADRLGEVADELVREAGLGGAYVVTASRATESLQPLWPREAQPVPGSLLVKVAARMSSTAAVSRRGELHHRELAPAKAIGLALGGLDPAEQLSPSDVLDAVRARFPELPPMPVRPRLDELMVDAGVRLRWNGEKYAPPTLPARSRGFTSISQVPILAGTRPTHHADVRLADSIPVRSFLAIGAPGPRLDDAARLLAERYLAVTVDVTAVLLEELRTQAQAVGIPWGEVQAADAADPGSRSAQGLTALVARAMPAVEEAITASVADVPEGTCPLLLVEAAPLSRYKQMKLLARLADIAYHRPQAIWLLLPIERTDGPTLDGTPLPLSHSGQYLRLDTDWFAEPSAPRDSVAHPGEDHER